MFVNYLTKNASVRCECIVKGGRTFTKKLFFRNRHVPLYVPSAWGSSVTFTCSLLADMNKLVFEPVSTCSFYLKKPNWIEKFYLKQIWIHDPGWTPNTWVPAVRVQRPELEPYSWHADPGFCIKEQVLELQNGQNTDLVNTNNHQQ